ncbi:M24 family metallopeptidase [Bradyrhizobium sp. 186]|nr:M24 family metallopeptidase [Bradyrhizobium sp. 186]
MPPSPQVPLEELDARLSRVRKEMERAHIDVVVLSDLKNIQYFTDYRTLSVAYKSRPSFVVITQDQLHVVGCPSEVKIMESAPRRYSVISYNGYISEAVDAVAERIRSGAASGRQRIAIDYGQEMLGRGSLRMLDRLKELASDGVVQTAVDLLFRVRMIKTPFEAAMKRTAMSIVNDAFDQVIAQAYIGITEFELSRMLQAQIHLNGAESADNIPMLFSDGDFVYGIRPSERRLREGHYIWTDNNATYGGYPADRNRIARCGGPQNWEIETYKRTRSLTIEVAKSFKPGLRCRDVYNNFLRLWKDADLGELYGHVSRIGHGGGLDITEPPSVSASDDTLILPGMIFHVEPKLEKNGAIFQFEEVIYVRENGVEFISELSPDELPIVPAWPKKSA